MVQKVKSSRWLAVVIIVLVVLVVAAAGAVVYFKFFSSSAGKSPEAVTNQKTPPPPPAVDRSTKSYTNTDLGVTLKIPVYWKEVQTSPSLTSLTAVDPDSGLTMNFEISRAGGNHAPCGFVLEASELIKYTEPLPGQRTETHLTKLGTQEDPTKLCAVMITGPKAFNKGESFNTVNPGPALAAQLPNELIVASFALTEDATKRPELATAIKAPVYQEAVDAMMSLQFQ